MPQIVSVGMVGEAQGFKVRLMPYQRHGGRWALPKAVHVNGASKIARGTGGG